MTASQQSILAELYEIDPGLREHEDALIPLLQQLLERDPAQKPSPAFVKKLRAELNARMQDASSGAVEHRMTYASPSAFFGRFAYALAGAVAAVVIAVPVTMQWQNGERVALMPGDGAPTMKIANPAMIEGRENAANDVAMPSGNPAPYATRPQGGGGMGGGGGIYMDGTMGAVSSLIAPWNPVKYKLEGDLPELPSGTVDVLDRNLKPLNVPFSSIQNAFKDASIDVSSFDGTSVESIAIAQRKPFGYYINISMTDGSVSINQMWDQWPHPENECRDEACYARLRPKLSDIPADAELIRISNAFLAEHDIGLDGYGAPVVDTAWRTQYDAMEDKRYAWVPDSIRVIYPLLIDGQTVNESGGEPAGVSVQVSIKHKRVSDVWGLMTFQFDHSDHPAVTERADIEKFLSYAGGQTPDAPTVTLSNPTIGYVRLYTYENGVNRELFVPALLFKVTGVPTGTYYYQTSVAVPLAKDLLDEARPPVPIDPIPMPYPVDGGPAVDVPAKEEPLMMEKVVR